MTTKPDPERFQLDDPRAHQNQREQAAWVRFVASAVGAVSVAAALGGMTTAQAVRGIPMALELADELLVELRKRDRTYDGDV